MSAVVTRNYPAICPVCGGCGSVPCDFYHRMGVSISTMRESCRSCGGNGVIWATETVSSPGIHGTPAERT